MRAIDFHVHVPREPGLPDSKIDESLRRHFRLSGQAPDIDGMAEHYKAWGIFGVIFSIDYETTSGEKPDSNDYVAGIVEKYPEQFIGFASVDPWRENAVSEIERSVRELRLSGLKLHPVQQHFYPNDERFYPIYETCSDLGVPVLFHSGFAASGLGMPGGGGLKLKYSAPIPYMDDVAADFPSLTIIMAHAGWPWTEEQIAVALHKPNAYIDLSGWLPKYLPEALVRETNSRLQDKVVFGSDYPYIPPDRWLRDGACLPWKASVREKVLLSNARRILGIK